VAWRNFERYGDAAREPVWKFARSRHRGKSIVKERKSERRRLANGDENLWPNYKFFVKPSTAPHLA